MRPLLFELGPFTAFGHEIGPIAIYTYGILLAAAYLLGLKLAMVRSKRLGLNSAHVLDLGVYVIIAALVGAKLLLVVTDFGSFWNDPHALLTLARSGGVFYGGLIIAVGVALWQIVRVGLPLWTTCDAFAPGIALGHIVGRMGCLFAGCCYGRPTRMPWGITFTNTLAAVNVGTPLGIPLHPTQLYEAGAEALILAVLLFIEPKGRRYPGRTFWLYLLLYAVSRYVIEIFRGDERGSVGMFSTSQFISLLLVPLAVGMLIYLSRRAAPSPRKARRAA
jgi:phosphatidylglycerol---prolipoprotein diacylglyceryl transferase